MELELEIEFMLGIEFILESLNDERGMRNLVLTKLTHTNHKIQQEETSRKKGSIFSRQAPAIDLQWACPSKGLI